MILLSLDINFLILWDAPSRRSTDIHRGIPSVARNGGTDDGSTKSRSTRIDRRAWLQDRRRDADAATNLVGPAHRGVAGRRAGAPPAFAIQKRWPHRAWSGPRQSRSLADSADAHGTGTSMGFRLGSPPNRTDDIALHTGEASFR